MKKSKSSATAQKEVQGQDCFYVCDGSVLKSLKELAKALKTMKPEVFSYHVNENKNDFSSWINDIFGETKLARDIYGVARAKAAQLVAARIK